MGLPDYGSIDEAVRGCFGAGSAVTESTYVSGGDINNATCLHLNTGDKIFVKSNSVKNRGFFDAEEEGLLAIANTHTIATPRLLCKGIDAEKNISFLMMEMIETGRPTSGSIRDFGYCLADMHRACTDSFSDGAKFGFAHDNYIGASKQINSPKNTWIGFFRECRLEPQFKAAEKYFDDRMIKSIIRFLDRLDDLLVEPAFPSLIHGDLWSGNYITGRDGNILLIDPAAYVGHCEADIAMTELFGRFPDGFYTAYQQKNPLQEGYEDRKEIYNLYHLTNHLNLFGSTYLHPVMQTIRRFSGL